MYYIDNTQQKLKKRMAKHWDEARLFALKGNKSDTFASHFGNHLLVSKKSGENLRAADVRALCKTEVLWYGNAITCFKTFRKNSCKLCMQERLFIYDEMKKDKTRPERKLINSGAELYGACRHQPVFHRFALPKLSTDEGVNPEKSLISGKSICLCGKKKKNCTRKSRIVPTDK